MKTYKKCLILGLLLGCVMSTTSRSQTYFYYQEEILARLQVDIEKDVLGYYQYNYSVQNHSKSTQAIHGFSLQLFTHSDSLDYFFPASPWDGPETLMQQDTLWVIWWADRYPIRARQIQSGFGYVSKLLPGIVDCTIFLEPLYALLQKDTTDSLSGVPVFHDNRIERKTVGPVLIEEPLRPSDFMNYLIGLSIQSFELGWIKKRHISDVLTRRLEVIDTKIGQREIDEPRKLLQEFIKDIEVRERKHLTKEAYYLLKFNAAYLLEALTNKQKLSIFN